MKVMWCARCFGNASLCYECGEQLPNNDCECGPGNSHYHKRCFDKNREAHIKKILKEAYGEHSL